MASKEVIAQKEAQVKELAESLKASNLVLIVDYRGITVEEDTKLRKGIREAKGNCRVIKNNILRRALDMNGESGLDEILVGPTAIITTEEDYLAPLKVVYKYAKANENYVIKGGFIDGKVMSVEEIKTLANLPSREELLSKLAGSLLQTIGKLAIALDQVKSKKESEAPVEEKKEEKVEEVKAEEAKTEEVAEAKEEVKAEEAKTEEVAEEKAEVKAEEAKKEETAEKTAEVKEEAKTEEVKAEEEAADEKSEA